MVTQDGYILNVQRIPEGRAGGGSVGGPNKQPVLLQHGVLVVSALFPGSRPPDSFILCCICITLSMRDWLLSNRPEKQETSERSKKLPESKDQENSGRAGDLSLTMMASEWKERRILRERS